MPLNSPQALALGASLCFAVGSLAFARVSRSAGAVWMNAFKASLAALLFGLTLFLTGAELHAEGPAVLALLVSGAIGLGLGDIFLLNAFAAIGPGRALMVFSFQPLLLGLLAAAAFQQGSGIRHAIAVLCFMLCVGILASEKTDQTRSANIKALAGALLALCLDAAGQIVTRWVFNSYPAVTPLEANLHRLLGALLFFAVYSSFRPLRFAAILKELPPRERLLAVGGAVVGTYASLMLYLAALRTGHLASVSGIAITTVIWATALECVIGRRLPSPRLLVSFVFFFAGMLTLFAPHG